MNQYELNFQLVVDNQNHDICIKFDAEDGLKARRIALKLLDRIEGKKWWVGLFYVDERGELFELE